MAFVDLDPPHDVGLSRNVFVSVCVPRCARGIMGMLPGAFVPCCESRAARCPPWWADATEAAVGCGGRDRSGRTIRRLKPLLCCCVQSLPRHRVSPTPKFPTVSRRRPKKQVTSRRDDGALPALEPCSPPNVSRNSRETAGLVESSNSGIDRRPGGCGEDAVGLRSLFFGDVQGKYGLSRLESRSRWRGRGVSTWKCGTEESMRGCLRLTRAAKFQHQKEVPSQRQLPRSQPYPQEFPLIGGAKNTGRHPRFFHFCDDIEIPTPPFYSVASTGRSFF